jgi:hypothetical protein
MQLYNQRDVSGVEVSSADTNRVRIRYSPLMESMYFSPGANVVEGNDGIAVELVRCPIKERCQVSHQASQESAGQLAIVVEHQGKPVFLAFKDGRRQIYPAAQR